MNTMSDAVQVEFTPTKVKALRKLYVKAVEHNEDRIIFQGNEYVTGYVKYLLEYLDQKFGRNEHDGSNSI